jgi:hypothetical protein
MTRETGGTPLGVAGQEREFDSGHDGLAEHHQLAGDRGKDQFGVQFAPALGHADALATPDQA